MAKKTSQGSRGSDQESRFNGAPSLTGSLEELSENALNSPSGYTGRMIAVFRDSEETNVSGSMLSAFAATAANSHEFDEDAVDFAALGTADALTFDSLGIAVLGGSAAYAAQESVAARTDDLSESSDSPYVLVPETIEWAMVEPSSYLRGFRAAADRIAADLAGAKGEYLDESPEADDEELAALLANTWGLNATRVPSSTFTGRGIRVAVLDTGLDLGHPDFTGRRILAQSFISGQSPQDVHGHGTHVTGTACGPRTPRTPGSRYGIAHECDILVGKVLADNGSGATGGILAGINWAMNNGARVINMSLGNTIATPALHYTQAGQRALAMGSLIVAAAGNNNTGTGQPANSPTILSVSSVTSTLQKSGFSNFGKVELAAPGSSIESALPRPRVRGFLSGTSMAAPHVAGIAALYAQGRNLRGLPLWRHLQSRARRLPLPVSQQGAGLVQA